MARNDPPPDDELSSLRRFADDLRSLRAANGNTPYRQLAVKAGFSASALSTATNGTVLPSLDVTLAYVGACGGESATWAKRWHQVRDELHQAALAPAAEAPSAPRAVGPARRRPRLVFWLVVGLAAATVGAGVYLRDVADRHPGPPPSVIRKVPAKPVVGSATPPAPAVPSPSVPLPVPPDKGSAPATTSAPPPSSTPSSAAPTTTPTTRPTPPPPPANPPGRSTPAATGEFLAPTPEARVGADVCVAGRIAGARPDRRFRLVVRMKPDGPMWPKSGDVAAPTFQRQVHVEPPDVPGGQLQVVLLEVTVEAHDRMTTWQNICGSSGRCPGLELAASEYRELASRSLTLDRTLAPGSCSA